MDVLIHNGQKLYVMSHEGWKAYCRDRAAERAAADFIKRSATK